MNLNNHFLKTILFLAGLLCIAGCTSEEVIFDKDQQLEAELRAIDAFLSEHDLLTDQHHSGFRYIIDEEGTGESFNNYCRRRLKLTVYHLDSTYFFSNYEQVEREQGFDYVYGDIFDSYACSEIEYTPVLHSLDELVRLGGKVQLFVPSALAFGTRGYDRSRFNSSGDRRIVSIPAHSTLLIRAEVIDAE